LFRAIFETELFLITRDTVFAGLFLAKQDDVYGVNPFNIIRESCESIEWFYFSEMDFCDTQKYYSYQIFSRKMLVLLLSNGSKNNLKR